MIGLTWLCISDRLKKGENEFDRQVVRAAPIRDIEGRSGAGPDISMMNFFTISWNINCSEKAEEYDLINWDLLCPLSKAPDAGPEGLFMPPGSHDLDRAVFEILPSDIAKTESGDDEFRNI